MRRFLTCFLMFNAVFFAAGAEEVRYTGASFRDPFAGRVQEKPADESVKTEQRLKTMSIQGILLSENNPRAIIGGKIYHVGSALDSGKISRIDKEGVAVTLNGKEIIIEQKIRKPANEIPKPK